MSSLKATGHRDNQRQRLYDAEHVVKYGSAITRHGQRFLVDEARLIRQSASATWAGPVTVPGKSGTYAPSIEDCQRYVDHLVREPWFQRRFGQRTYRVVWKAYGSATCSGGGIIALPPWARTEGVILHEVAHGIRHAGAWHGPEFAALLLFLVRQRMGKAKADALRTEFRHNRVRVKPAAVPKPTREVVTATERRERAARRQVRQDNEATTAQRRTQAAWTIRYLVTAKTARFGAVGTKPRRYAQDTARLTDAKAVGGRRGCHADDITRAAETVRALVRQGHYGAPGCKPRARAQAVARTLETIAALYQTGGRTYAATPQRW